MSNRYITKQQFSDGTTIDGNRIESALQDLEALSDLAPYGAIKTRFTQSQLVFGWAPILDGAAPQEHPFMEFTNSTTDRLNTFRLKGITSGGPIWETAVQFDHPVILHAVDYVLAQDDGTPSGVQAYAFPGMVSPPNYEPPNVTDVNVQVLVDAEYIAIDRTQADIELHKHSFNTDAWNITSVPLAGAPATTMLPVYPGGNLSGWAITLNDLNIPIRSFAHVRIALKIPASGAAVWGSHPWRNFSPTLTATFLEPNRNA